MKKMFYELAVTNPGAVAWYCGLKLEMAVHLTKDLLTQQMQSSAVPGLDAVKNRVESSLREKLRSDVNLDQIPDLVHLGYVDDFYASFEWSSGGLVHAHMAYLFRLWLLSIPPTQLYHVSRGGEQGVGGSDGGGGGCHGGGSSSSSSSSRK